MLQNCCCGSEYYRYSFESCLHLETPQQQQLITKHPPRAAVKHGHSWLAQVASAIITEAKPA
jgi:hypothetical protein